MVGPVTGAGPAALAIAMGLLQPYIVDVKFKIYSSTSSCKCIRKASRSNSGFHTTYLFFFPISHHKFINTTRLHLKLSN